MKNILNLSAILFVLLFVSSCTTDFGVGAEKSGDVTTGVAGDTEGGSYSSDLGTETGNGNGNDNSAYKGLITAAEWNDLDNWDFWVNLLNRRPEGNPNDSNYVSVLINDFEFYTVSKRYAVEVDGYPKENHVVKLLDGKKVLWETVTDIYGKANVFYNPFSSETNASNLRISVDGQVGETFAIPYENGVNTFTTNTKPKESKEVDIAFIVDATGSMSDELEFLKKDLEDVIHRVEKDNASLAVNTAAVYYRDVEDDYLVKSSPFTSNLGKTVAFIKKQHAEGGGDFPEAVHSALEEAFEKLQWSQNTRAKIAFLLLDAPPHKEDQVISSLHKQIKVAARMGVKLIPISASGIDKSTEYLLRSFSILTNSTYVFVTNDSGIGNEHIEASVGDYEVEYLNDLMVRLIKKYTDL